MEFCSLRGIQQPIKINCMGVLLTAKPIIFHTQKLIPIAEIQSITLHFRTCLNLHIYAYSVMEDLNKQSALVRLLFSLGPAQFRPLCGARIAQCGRRVGVPELVGGDKLTLGLEAFLVVGFIVLLPEFLQVVDLTLDLCFSLLVLLFETLDHQVFLSDYLLFLTDLASCQLETTQGFGEFLAYVACLSAGVFQCSGQFGIFLNEFVMPVGHERGLASGTGHYSFLNIFQEVFLASNTVFFGLVADYYLFVGGNTTQRSGKQFEIGGVRILGNVFRGACAQRLVNGWSSECYFPLTFGVIFRLTVGIMIRVILVFFILENVQSKRLILYNAISAYSFLFIEFFNNLVLCLDLHLRLFKQSHQLLHSEFLMAFARCPNRRVVTVSAQLQVEGDTFTIKLVREFPPKLYWRSRVSLESRQGTCPPFPSDKECITLPRADRLVLILIAQLSCLPSVPVLEIFSLPARSITVRRALLAYPVAKSLETSEIMKSMCDREETAFIWVHPTDRFSNPYARSWYPYSVRLMYLSVTCQMKTPLFLFSLNFRLRLVRSSRSVTFSLYISTRDTFARRSMFEGRILTRSITAYIMRGSSPRLAPLSSGPTQVQVFPEAVCPQQKMVPLIPQKDALTISSATMEYTASCSACSAKTRSKAKLRQGEVPVPSKLVTLSARQSSCSMQRLVPSTCDSSSLRGRTRTKTFMLLPRSFIFDYIYLGRSTGCQKKNILHQYSGQIGQEVYSHVVGNVPGTQKQKYVNFGIGCYQY